MATDSPVPPSALVFIGVVLTAPGMFMLLLGEGSMATLVIGPLLVLLGGMSGMVGVIGAGVMVGVRRAEWVRGRR